MDRWDMQERERDNNEETPFSMALIYWAHRAYGWFIITIIIIIIIIIVIIIIVIVIVIVIERRREEDRGRDRGDMI